jgi:hypothetical protein
MMSDYIKFIKDIAPTVAGFLGTPAMGVATKALLDAFGGDEETVTAITNGTRELSSEDIAKIKLAEIGAKAKADELGLKFYEAEVEDRKSAREMQVEALHQDDRFSKRFIYYFATLWSMFAMIYIAGITFIDIPDDNTRVVDTVLGFILGTVIATILAFFYGTSASSMKKTEMMSNK